MKQPMARRLGWGVVDQIFSSGTNFAVSVAAARALTPVAFGSFAIAFSLYIIALGLSRSLCTEPLVVRWSAAGSDDLLAAARKATGAAAAFGLFAGAGLVVTGALLRGDVGWVIMALGFALPGLLLQDAWRYVFFAAGRPKAAAANDLVWASAQIVSYGALFAMHSRSPASFVGGWGIAATAGALFGITQTRVMPSLACGVGWIRHQADLGLRFAADSIASSGATQGVMLAVGAIVGVAAVGGLRAGAVLMGPLNILFIGFTSVVMPESVRDLQHSPERFLLRLRWLSLALGGAALVWSAALSALPTSMGRQILGASWRTGHPLLPAFALIMTAAGALAGATVGLRALGAADRALKCRLRVMPLTLVFGVAGGFIAAGLGTAWGLAAANGIAAIIYWRAFLKALAAFNERQVESALSGAILISPQAAERWEASVRDA